MTDTTRKPGNASLADYYSAGQLRGDRWTALKSVTGRLSETSDPAKLAQFCERAREILHSLEPIEMYWAFPGRVTFERFRHLLAEERYTTLARDVKRVVRLLHSGGYRKQQPHLLEANEEHEEVEGRNDEAPPSAHPRPYFEVLVVDSVTAHEEDSQRGSFRRLRKLEDKFIYEVVFVPSLEDALIAVLFNHNIQTVIVRSGFVLRSANRLPLLTRTLSRVGDEDIEDIDPEDYGPELCRLLGKLRPEIDVFLVTDSPVEDIAGRELGNCKRVFYKLEDFVEQHLNILRALNSRYQTPFFNALKEYSRQPTGVFHAMPISRGKSIIRSNWIQDMGDFYGMNIFMAETSATSGGLDSLLEPTGPIKKAQQLAARAFGSRQTYFATNGTSTCNKVVVQAIVRPGDIVLVDRDCHKSHHYGMVLSGASVVYLDSYPLHAYSMYGAVPMKEIKHKLLELKAAGKLHRVRMLLLTNCTFDGIVYNVEKVMQECLAIKPDLVFLWDEAWFAFARFGPAYRQRTAMHCAQVLRDRYKSEEYRVRYNQHMEEIAAEGGDEPPLPLMPNPDKVRVRVYATQSTHKTLTSLRQGSMIHVHDQDFKGEIAQAFHEAYMTHTSTSPNYQIIASLDVGRRQVELEGFELVQKQVEAAMAIRKSVSQHPLLNKYFKILTVKDMIPKEYRDSEIESYWDPEHGWADIWDAWSTDEFALDATRVTLAVGSAGYDGDDFKTSVLMDKFGIQVNKTSRNTVLFMTNIGTTRSSVAYLIEVLVEIAQELDGEYEDAGPMEKRAFLNRVTSLTKDLPPLPDFSAFHTAFRTKDGTGTPEGDIREAFFLAYDEAKCEYFPLEGRILEGEMAKGRELVSTSFIIPYPPGFPILVPGQVISKEILEFMRALDVSEIHGYRPELGLRVFRQDALDALSGPEKLAAE